jgi:hypothetical protein
MSIPGYTEVAGVPGANQYRVDWTYMTGLVEFHSSDAGNSVTANYKGLGTPITAAHFNNLIDRDPVTAWRSSLWAYEEVVEDFMPKPSGIVGGGGPWPSYPDAIFPDINRWIRRYTTASQVHSIAFEDRAILAGEYHLLSVQLLGGATALAKAAVTRTQYKGQQQGPVVVTGRFRLSTDELTNSDPVDFLIGVGSFNGNFDAPDVVPGFGWSLGSALNTAAFRTQGGIVLDNIPTSWTWYREYTIAFTPGLVELFIDRTLVGTTATFIGSSEPGSGCVFMSRTASFATAVLYADYYAMRMLGPGLQA